VNGLELSVRRKEIFFTLKPSDRARLRGLVGVEDKRLPSVGLQEEQLSCGSRGER
jgi:hypothetical protein